MSSKSKLLLTNNEIHFFMVDVEAAFVSLLPLLNSVEEAWSIWKTRDGILWSSANTAVARKSCFTRAESFPVTLFKLTTMIESAMLVSPTFNSSFIESSGNTSSYEIMHEKGALQLY